MMPHAKRSRLSPTMYAGFCAAAAAVLAATTAVSDGPPEPVLVDPGLPVWLEARSGASLDGRITRYTAERFVVVDEQGRRFDVPWVELPAKSVYDTYKRLMDDADARHWLALGGLLAAIEDGKELSDTAFSVALNLDESLCLRVEAARAASGEPSEGAPRAGRPGIADVLTPADAADLARYSWAGRNRVQRDKFIAAEKAFADEVAQELGVEFTVVETSYFLYYTTVPPNKTQHSPRLIDQMYDKTCDLFGIPRGLNIFKGKALVFMFDTQEQFLAYARAYDGPKDAAGFCENHGSGSIRIVMYQGERRRRTTHTMLHETAHGVTFAYRTPVHVVSWLNEGIADWVASQTTGYLQIVKWRQSESRKRLRRKPKMPGSAVTPGMMSEWAYGAGYSMTNMLISRSREQFVDFMKAIKDGQPWEVALREHYELTASDLAERYGRKIGVLRLEW